tara:strand:- start:53 stop:289 length:237 start_codon:yes stop_codon:yes gene_type:complete
MKVSDLKIGLRVYVRPSNLVALIVGQPEYYSPSAKLVRIKYENSTRYEHMINYQMDQLPTDEQYPAHGGTYVRPEGAF